MLVNYWYHLAFWYNYIFTRIVHPITREFIYNQAHISGLRIHFSVTKLKTHRYEISYIIKFDTDNSVNFHFSQLSERASEVYYLNRIHLWQPAMDKACTVVSSLHSLESGPVWPIFFGKKKSLVMKLRNIDSNNHVLSMVQTTCFNPFFVWLYTLFIWTRPQGKLTILLSYKTIKRY